MLKRLSRRARHAVSQIQRQKALRLTLALDSSWWARRLYEAVQDLGQEWPDFTKMTVSVVSGCTGCSAESAVLKAGKSKLRLFCW